MFESNIWQILLISKMWYGFASSVLRGHIVSETYQKAKRHCHLVTKAVIYFVPEGLFAAYIYLNNIDAVYFFICLASLAHGLLYPMRSVASKMN